MKDCPPRPERVGVLLGVASVPPAAAVHGPDAQHRAMVVPVCAGAGATFCHVCAVPFRNNDHNEESRGCNTMIQAWLS